MWKTILRRVLLMLPQILILSLLAFLIAKMMPGDPFTGLITPEVFSAIQDAKEAGVKVVIATGRPIAGVAKLLDDLQLRDEGDYVVTFNGALVQETATGHEIISESLTYEDYLDMEFLSRKLGVHMHAITKDGIYTANRNIGKYTVHESTLVNMPIFYRTPEEMADKEIVKCMFIDEPKILDTAIEKIPAEFYERYSINKSAISKTCTNALNAISRRRRRRCSASIRSSSKFACSLKKTSCRPRKSKPNWRNGRCRLPNMKSVCPNWKKPKPRSTPPSKPSRTRQTASAANWR